MAARPYLGEPRLPALPSLAERAQGNGAKTEPPELLVDQAVFTSVRSHLAGGYRLIAASPGIHPEERAEMIRRAPSHGSLCDDGPDAVGMLAFALPTGRYCVGHVEYAGLEPSGRGGGRVYTHFAVLDDAQRGAFGCNPVAIWRALQLGAPGERILSPRVLTEPLTLMPPEHRAARSLELQATDASGPSMRPPADRLTRTALDGLSRRLKGTLPDHPRGAQSEESESAWSVERARMLVRLHEAVALDMAVLIEGDDGDWMVEQLCMIAGKTRSGGLSLSIGLRHSSMRRMQVTSVPVRFTDSGAWPGGERPAKMDFAEATAPNRLGKTPVAGSAADTLLVFRAPIMREAPPPSPVKPSSRPLGDCRWRHPWPTGPKRRLPR